MAEQQDKKDKGPKGPKGPPAEAQAKKAKKAAKSAEPEAAAEEPRQPAPPARLWVRYRQEIVPKLKESLGVKNDLAVPRLEKIVISMGLGKIMTAGGDAKAKMEQAEKELAVIAGQKPVRCKAKKSVANFKVREGMETGLKVTLRGARMYEFLDRLISLVIPRVKDFRGLEPNGFDREGNYSFGFTEQTVFPEVDAANVTFQQGMNITLCSNAGSVQRGRELLRAFGMPFRDDAKKETTAA